MTLSADAVIPVRLPAPYLAEAVASLCAQSTQPHRIIVVAHGCASEVSGILTRFGSRVEVVEVSANASLATVRNTGIGTCDCDAVALLDADDLALPERIQAQLAALESIPSSVMVTSAVEVIDGYGRKIGLRYVYGGFKDLRTALILRNRIAQSAVMLRRSAFAQYRDLKYCEDYDLWLRMAAKGAIQYSAVPLTKYRVHSQQITGGKVVPLQAWGALLHSRLTLGRALGESSVTTFSSHALWCIAQSLQYIRYSLACVFKSVRHRNISGDEQS